MPSNDLIARWGSRLARARAAAGLSIGELARQTGIHKSHLARFELGEAGLGDEYRILVAAKVGQPVSELFPYPEITDQESECPSAASVPAEVASRTPATTAAPRSPARSAKAPAESVPRANRGIEGGAR